jgi:hypothetical protein
MTEQTGSFSKILPLSTSSIVAATVTGFVTEATRKIVYGWIDGAFDSWYIFPKQRDARGTPALAIRIAAPGSLPNCTDSSKNLYTLSNRSEDIPIVSGEFGSCISALSRKIK